MLTSDALDEWAGSLVAKRLSVHDTPDPTLLQALEHTVEALKRTSDVLTTALDAMQRGARFSDATIADYRSQLENVEADRLRMEELLRVLWSQVEKH